VSAPINLVGASFVTASGPDLLTLSGVISGTGSLKKVGSGEVDLAGSVNNTFTGGMNVNEGLLGLVKQPYYIAIPGPLVVGDGTNGAAPYIQDEVDCFANGQIADTAAVTVNSSGLLQLYADTTIGPLTLNAGMIDTSQATLTLNGDVATLPGFWSSIIKG